MSAEPSGPFAFASRVLCALRPLARVPRETAYREPALLTKPRLVLGEAAGYRTTFERAELKYWVTERLADRIAEFAQPYLQLDPFSRTGRKTRNISLYLDTRGLVCLEDHVSGALDRWKLRVRTYGEDPSGVAFFEVKRKIKSITLKTRATLPVSAVADLLTGRRVPVPANVAERKHLDRFVFLQRLHRVEPQVLIAAHRQAFVSRRGDDVRMTIDREIVYQPARGPTLVPRSRAWVTVPGPDEGRSCTRSVARSSSSSFAGRRPRGWRSSSFGSS